MKPILNPLFAKRRNLFLSSASVAIATAALYPQAAHAQAFIGTMTPTPSATQSITGANSETITVNGPTATINWNPNNGGTGTIDFLPQGNSATFTSAPGVSDYTVLNRIVPSDTTRAIGLNGSIQSFLEGTSTSGGNIWFYSPGGIAVGASARFDVGGLLLTSLNVSSFDASGGEFAAGRITPGKISIASGATIDALQQGSYVALVAPRIEQGGTVRVNGSAAYVAATAVTMTMNQGLFDISVDVGTDDPNGVVHTGETSGPANITAADNHTLYLVAVPKNNALTMLLGGTLGFDDATSATVENGKIILSSGWDVDSSHGAVSFSRYSESPDASVNIGASHFTSDVQGVALGIVNISATGGDVLFDGDLAFNSVGAPTSDAILLTADNAHLLEIGGDVQLASDGSPMSPSVTLSAANDGSIEVGGSADLSAGQSNTGDPGQVSLLAQGGDIVIAGGARIDVSHDGATATSESFVSDNRGGTALLYASNSGSITTGDLAIDASASGDNSEGRGDDTASAGQGGEIDLIADGDGSITIDGSGDANADGLGGNMLDGSFNGGAGTGGTVYVRAGDDSSLNVTGDFLASANGTGGSYWGEGIPTTAQGGSGAGGRVGVQQAGGTLTIGGTTTLRAIAVGGDGQSGGDARGGGAGIYGEAGIATLADLDFSATATGGSAVVGYGGSGGDAQGGSAYVQADSNPGNGEVPLSAATIVGGNAALDVSGTGGAGGAGDGVEIAAGSGGGGIGGYYNSELGSGGAFALSGADGGSLTLGDVELHSVGTGGQGGAGGAGQAGGSGGYGYGGLAQVGQRDAYRSGGHSGSSTFGTLLAESDGIGGAGGNGESGLGDGGEGDGGGAYLTTHGNVVAGDTKLYANATGGAGGQGGAAYGGLAQATSRADSTVSVNGWLDVQALGTGGTGAGGDGGEGVGGEADVIAAGGLSVTAPLGAVFAWATGQGGNSDSGSAGDGSGGIASITVDASGNLTTNQIYAFADAAAGASITGNGGFANAGEAKLIVDGGIVSAQRTYVTADALGGAGVDGGAADGGVSTIDITSNGGSLNTQTLELHSWGYGGDGNTGSGGDGTGGVVDFSVSSGSTQVSDNALVSASAIGGSSTDSAGGNADGGSVSVAAEDGASLRIGDLTLTSDGTGGDGVIAGNASGGSVDLAATGGGASITLGTANLSANGLQGAGEGSEGPPTGSGGSVDVAALGGSLDADIVSASANGSTAGGNVLLVTSQDSGEYDTSFGFGSLEADADGDYYGGTVNLVAGTGTVADVGNAVLGASGFGGFVGVSAGDCGCGPDDLLAASLTLSSGGDIAIATGGGSALIVSGTLQARADGTVTFIDDGGLGTVTADLLDVQAQDIQFSGAILGDTITANSMILAVDGDFAIGDLGVSENLSVSAGGNLQTGDLSAGGTLALNSFADIQTGNLSGETGVVVSASGDLTIGGVSGTDDVSLTAGGDLQTGDLDAGGGLALSAGGNIGGGNMSAGAGVLIDAFGDLAVGDVSSVDDLSLTAGGNLQAGDLDAGGGLALSAGGNIDGGNMSAGAGVLIDAFGDLAVGDVSSVDDLSLSAGGDLQTGDLDAGGGLALSAGGNIGGGNMSAGADVVVNALGDLAVGDVRGTDADFTAGGLASFYGIVSAPTITVTSGDINIAAGGSLGVWGVTDLLTLNAVTDGAPIIIGEDGDGPSEELAGYHLSEDGDIKADSVVVNAVGTGVAPADVQVYDTHIDGSESEGGGVHSVALNTDGTIRVLGNIEFVDASATDTLLLSAGQRIEVITPVGSIKMTGPSDLLAGILTLKSDNIVVTDQSLAAQLAADPNFDGHAEALATNTGPVNPAGYLQAGGIVLLGGSNIFIQNTGTATELAGVTVGDEGLVIGRNQEGAAPAAQVIVFGRRENGDGSFTTGQDFFDEVDFGLADGVKYAAGSTFNGCQIISGCAAPPSLPPLPQVPNQLSSADGIFGALGALTDPGDQGSDDQDDDSDDGKGKKSNVNVSLGLINANPVELDQQITDPVTSGSDGLSGIQ